MPLLFLLLLLFSVILYYYGYDYYDYYHYYSYYFHYHDYYCHCIICIAFNITIAVKVTVTPGQYLYYHNKMPLLMLPDWFLDRLTRFILEIWKVSPKNLQIWKTSLTKSGNLDIQTSTATYKTGSISRFPTLETSRFI